MRGGRTRELQTLPRFSLAARLSNPPRLPVLLASLQYLSVIYLPGIIRREEDRLVLEFPPANLRLGSQLAVSRFV